MVFMQKRIRGAYSLLSYVLLVSILTVLVVPVASRAQEDASVSNVKQEIDTLNAQVKDKEQRIKELDATISKYKKSISANENAVASLQNQVTLMENQVEEKRLATERTRNQIELVNLEIQRISGEISLAEKTIKRRQDSLAELVRQMQEADAVSLFDTFLARPSLSEFFTRLDELKRVEGELTQATKDIKASKREAEEKKVAQEARRVELQQQRITLNHERDQLEEELTAKASLVSETQNKEEEFQRILYELRQQQQGEADDVSALRDKLQDRLDSVDQALARGDILLSWPIKALKGVSATFHDPDYPFRRLFEHPGIDLPTPVGTPVKAAAGGYVAWNKTGKQYGNYVMIVHPGGVATVYAHLSAFAAKADTYVERGQIIGYSGGRPGDEGAGLSTGAHLHFEVRQNGIPVNPENFLASLE